LICGGAAGFGVVGGTDGGFVATAALAGGAFEITEAGFGDAVGTALGIATAGRGGKGGLAGARCGVDGGAGGFCALGAVRASRHHPASSAAFLKFVLVVFSVAFTTADPSESQTQQSLGDPLRQPAASIERTTPAGSSQQFFRR